MPRNSSTVCDRQRDFQSIVSSQSPFEAHQLEFARASRAFELILLFLRALYAECELNKSASPVMGPASSRDAAANRRIVNWCGGSVLCRLGASTSLSFSVAGFKEATEGETGRPILHYFLSDFLFTEFFFHSCLCVSVCVCVCQAFWMRSRRGRNNSCTIGLGKYTTAGTVRAAVEQRHSHRAGAACYWPVALVDRSVVACPSTSAQVDWRRLRPGSAPPPSTWSTTAAGRRRHGRPLLRRARSAARDANEVWFVCCFLAFFFGAPCCRLWCLMVG